ncbi:MAG TPA: gliding motility-associated C-terminal domain-containing protein [Bacteroidia bacterium]|jgi:gliding motility-associated-like protein|nr:gliding motility-associated C-terminal domain-containing protein [Bacteroidia bacterium]
MKKIIYIIFFVSSGLFAQVNVPPPQVFNSAGTTAKVNGNYYGFNIGEPIAQTANTGTNYYTQGFLQPDYKIGTAFGASIHVGGESCQGAGDGFLVANPFNNGGHVKFSLSPSPSPADTTSTMYNLPPGTYNLTIRDSVGNVLTKTIIIQSSTKECEDTVYHAFSPNDDGLNDLFIIGGIKRFPDNHVFFFNRWGQLVWDKKNYDNVKVVWDGKDNAGVPLTSGTYFYVIDRKGGTTQKNWVELTK